MSAADVAELKAHTEQLFINFLSYKGQGYTYPAVADGKLDGIAAQIAAIAAGGVSFPGAPYNAFVALINEMRGGRGESNVEVDEEALAKALAPLMPGYMGALSDADVQRIAEAAANEHAKRLAG